MVFRMALEEESNFYHDAILVVTPVSPEGIGLSHLLTGVTSDGAPDKDDINNGLFCDQQLGSGVGQEGKVRIIAVMIGNASNSPKLCKENLKDD